MTDQEKRDAYFVGKVMPVFEIQISFRPEGHFSLVSTSFNNVGDMVNWAIQQIQSAATDGLSLYGVQRKVEDDF